MKTLIIILLLLSFNVPAVELLLETGKRSTFFARPDNYSPATYSAIALRFGDQKFVELIQAGWHGNEFARFTGVGFGVQSQGKWFAEGVVSLIHLTEGELMDQDGDYQALLTAGIGHRFDDFSVTLRFRHLSNGNTSDNNHGRDFKIIGVNIVF